MFYYAFNLLLVFVNHKYIHKLTVYVGLLNYL